VGRPAFSGQTALTVGMRVRTLRAVGPRGWAVREDAFHVLAILEMLL
jgi:hypothetical protein